MITDNEFRRVAVYMKDNYGIDLSQKKVIINGRLENYLRKSGWASLDAYMDALKTDRSGQLDKMLVNFLTTNHTYFMREPFFRGLGLRKSKKRICASGAARRLPGKSPI